MKLFELKMHKKLFLNKRLFMKFVVNKYFKMLLMNEIL